MKQLTEEEKLYYVPEEIKVSPVVAVFVSYIEQL